MPPGSGRAVESRYPPQARYSPPLPLDPTSSHFGCTSHLPAILSSSPPSANAPVVRAESIVLGHDQERRARPVVLAIEGIVCGVTVATDKQHREAFRSVGVVTVFVSSENHEQAVRRDVRERVGVSLQLPRFNVLGPSARAQVRLAELLLVLNRIPHESRVANGVDTFLNVLLRHAVIDIDERVSCVGSRAQAHRMSIVPEARVVDSSRGEEVLPVESGRGLPEPVGKRLGALLQCVGEIHGVLRLNCHGGVSLRRGDARQSPRTSRRDAAGDGAAPRP